MFCPNCGRECKDGRFCMGCGTRLPEEAVELRDAAPWRPGMACPFCGANEVEGNRCAYCGGVLASGEADTQEDIEGIDELLKPREESQMSVEAEISKRRQERIGRQVREGKWEMVCPRCGSWRFEEYERGTTHRSRYYGRISWVDIVGQAIMLVLGIVLRKKYGRTYRCLWCGHKWNEKTGE